MNVESMSAALRFDAETEVWRADRAHEVSYPADDHATCFAIEDGSFWFGHRNRCITALVRRYPPAGWILDVGGGNGYVTRGLMDAGFEAALLEPGLDGATNARRARRVPTVICATFEEAAIRPGSVPAIGLFDVLEHVEDDGAFVGQLHQAMAPAGLLYITVPAFTWLWSASDADALHYRRYTPQSLAAVLTPRFDVLYATCIFRRLVPLFFAMRTLPYRLGLSRSRSSDAYKSDHAAGGGAVSSMVERLLRSEVAAVQQGRTSNVGSSLLVAARRRD